MEMQGVREFLRGPAGKGVAVVLVLAGAVVAFFSVRNNLGASEAELLGRTRVYMCSETHQTFKHDLAAGETNPIYSPLSGKNTGYPTEPCYWTADGKPKDDPTYVLLNETLRQPGPTFCPDCGRLVKPHNPMPVAGDRPPPTKAQYRPTGVADSGR